jgi:hypothetical protein
MLVALKHKSGHAVMVTDGRNDFTDKALQIGAKLNKIKPLPHKIDFLLASFLVILHQSI